MTKEEGGKGGGGGGPGGREGGEIACTHNHILSMTNEYSIWPLLSEPLTGSQQNCEMTEFLLPALSFPFSP